MSREKEFGEDKSPGDGVKGVREAKTYIEGAELCVANSSGLFIERPYIRI